jgi:lipoprotein-anchoring transpeptidase ErfK/SrfK
MRLLVGGVVLALVLAGNAAEAQDVRGLAAPVAVATAPAEPSVAEAAAATPGEGRGPSAAVLAAAIAADQIQSPVLLPITLVLRADLAAQRLTVVENHKVKYVWPISSGRAGFATASGTFRVQWMTRMWHSRQYEWAPMPHAMFFNRGTAFHGTSAVGMLGRPASHGCVRLAPANAARLFGLVQRHGLGQTKVVVHGGKSREPLVAGRRVRGEKKVAATFKAARPPSQRGSRRAYRVSRNTNPWWF